MKPLIFLMAALLLSACAGTAFKWDDVQRVEVGMTQQEVISMIGKPNLVMAQGDSTILAWSHATAFGSVRSVSIAFGKDGKVKAKPPLMIDMH